MSGTQSVSIRLGHVKTTDEARGTEAEMKTLVESMREVGQLQEIVLNSQHEVIAGRRRVEAARRLRLTHIRAFINPSFDDAIKALKAERDENCPGCRVPLTRSQQLELARQLEALENPAAAARKAAAQAKKGQQIGSGTAKFAAPNQKGRARDKVGELIGMSGYTLAKAQAVIDAGQKQPDRYLDLAQKVSRDKQPIDPVHQEFQARKEVYDAADGDRRFADVAAKLTETHDTEAAHAEYERLREEQTKDKAGEPIPKRLVKVFSDSWLADGAAAMLEARASIKAWLRTAWSKCERCEHLDKEVLKSITSIADQLASMSGVLSEAQPHAVCPKCKSAGCKTCKDAGWLTKQLYGALKSAA